jgi:hypothetical protein
VLSLPQRGLEHYRSEELRTHGFYARRQPPQAVADMLQQDIQGIDEEFAGLRILGRGLLARQEQTRSSHELASLMEAYTLLAYRLDEMVRAEKELQKKAEDDRSGQELLEFLERIAEALFEPAPVRDEGDALPFEAPELDEASRQLVEEVASLRCVIRNAFALAMEAEDTRTYMRMVDVYGSACTRMVRLLKSGDSPYARLREQFSQALDKVIEEFTVEWNLRGDV